jgi:hypothetical protein
MEQDLFRVTGRSPAGRLFVALWGGLAIVDMARPGGALLAGTLVIALAAACGAGQSWPAATSIATTGWLVVNGFVEHRYGELGFGRTSWFLLVLGLVATHSVAARTTRSAVR